MGASRFYREHAALMREGTRADHAQRVEDAYAAVRDKWIAEKRYLELVKAITANWTSGNCVDFMAPLSRALIVAGETGLHRHLWSRTIKRQVDVLFHRLASVPESGRRYLRLLNLDTMGFDETDPASYRHAERAAAFALQRLNRDLGRWRDELRSGALATDEPDRIERSVQALRRPRITVNRLPPLRDNAPGPKPLGDMA